MSNSPLVRSTRKNFDVFIFCKVCDSFIERFISGYLTLEIDWVYSICDDCLFYDPRSDDDPSLQQLPIPNA